jgi:hypothetical protein
MHETRAGEARATGGSCRRRHALVLLCCGHTARATRRCCIRSLCVCVCARDAAGSCVGASRRSLQRLLCVWKQFMFLCGAAQCGQGSGTRSASLRCCFVWCNQQRAVAPSPDARALAARRRRSRRRGARRAAQRVVVWLQRRCARRRRRSSSARVHGSACSTRGGRVGGMLLLLRRRRRRGRGAVAARHRLLRQVQRRLQHGHALRDTRARARAPWHSAREPAYARRDPPSHTRTTTAAARFSPHRHHGARRRRCAQ